MALTRGKIVIAAIFVGVAAAFFGLYYSYSLQPPDVSSKINVILANVQMKNIDRDDPTLMIVRVDFGIFNGSEQTLAVSKIDYELYANEALLGRGSLSLEDIPLTGRAPLYPSANTVLPSEMKLRKSPDIADVWNRLQSGTTEDITWRTDGVAQIESAFSIFEVHFSSTFSTH